MQQPSDITILSHDDIIIGFNKAARSLAGLGADDKNGIWIALQCFLKYSAIKLAFFVEEETGCCGSHACDMSFFNDARFVIQCDRKGNSDFVATACGVKLCTDKFVEDAKIGNFKYTKCLSGGLTDVKTLRSKGLKVCSCNISCGYYNPHTDYEITDFKDLQNCLSLVEHMVENMTEIYEFPVETKPTYEPHYGRSYHSNGFYGAGLGSETYYEESLFEDFGNIHVKRSKKQKVDAKNYAEQRQMVELGLKEAMLSNDSYTPYDFYVENKNLLPNISYGVITQIYNRLRRELFK